MRNEEDKRIQHSTLNVQHSTFLVLLRRIALVAVFAIVAARARALEPPPPPAQWFTDAAGIVSAQQAQELNDKLRAFEQQQGAQFIVYTFPSLEGEAVEDFTI